jgi:hypothetical protein
MYNASSLAGVPWVSMLGNHDYYGGHPDVQIDYSNAKVRHIHTYMVALHGPSLLNLTLTLVLFSL